MSLTHCGLPLMIDRFVAERYLCDGRVRRSMEPVFSCRQCGRTGKLDAFLEPARVRYTAG